MITHLVGWNLTAEDKDAGAVAVKHALESLVGVVPGLLDLTVARNAVAVDRNSELALVSHFETEDDLRVYLTHPAHLAAVEVVRANTTDRWAIDLEL